MLNIIGNTIQGVKNKIIEIIVLLTCDNTILKCDSSIITCDQIQL